MNANGKRSDKISNDGPTAAPPGRSIDKPARRRCRSHNDRQTGNQFERIIVLKRTQHSSGARQLAPRSIDPVVGYGFMITHTIQTSHRLTTSKHVNQCLC